MKNTYKLNVQNFNNDLIKVIPEYKDKLKFFSILKLFNYYLYAFIFVFFLLFFIIFFIINVELQNSHRNTFNELLFILELSFFFNIFSSAISFQQHLNIYQKFTNIRIPLVTYYTINTIVFFIFTSTIISPTFSLFLTYLSFQIPYLFFIFKVEKHFKNTNKF